MNVEFRMPDIGEGLTEVEVIEWLVGVGDAVIADQPIVIVQTDKATVEMPASTSGVITRMGAAVGEILPVGEVLFVIDSTDPPASSDQSDAPPPVTELGVRPPAGRRPMASPVIRRLAQELGIDLAQLVGTGPGGRVTRDDVTSAAQPNRENVPAADAPGTEADATERVPLRGLRRAIAKKMIESWRNVPHITDFRQVDASKLIEMREELRRSTGEPAAPISYLPILVKITASALRAHPLLNATFEIDADEYVLRQHINVGVATSTEAGLVVPVVHDADRKSIVEIAEELHHLVGLARAGRSTLAQQQGGTYTVSNFGTFGVSMSTPIIRSPEVGILGVGRIAEQVIAEAGVAVVRPIITLSSVGDHRIHDGDTLSAFTTTLASLIESPFRLMAELR